MPEPVIVQSENDKMIAAEEAFIASVAAKDEPAAVVPVVQDPAVTDDPPVVAESGAPGAAVETPAGEDAGVMAPPDEEEEVEVTDEAFAAAMQAERASVSLEDVPEAARPIVQKKIKDLEAGFTRTMQKVRADQKDAIAIKAEARFQAERPDDFIVQMLLAKPELMEQVNAKLNEFDASPTAREAHGVVVERAREKALAAENDVLAKAEANEKRAADIVRMGKAAARAAKVPWEAGVEANIAAHLAINSDITEADIRAIAADTAKLWNKALREQGRTKSQEYVAAKVQDRKAGLTVRPSTGTAPAPSARPVPKNDDEFIAQFAATL
jgi:hypothetical protein